MIIFNETKYHMPAGLCGMRLLKFRYEEQTQPLAIY